MVVLAFYQAVPCSRCTQDVICSRLVFERDVSVSENLRSVSRTAGSVHRSSSRSPLHPLFGYSVGPWVTEPPNGYAWYQCYSFPM